jgi:hypothetical protein
MRQLWINGGGIDVGGLRLKGVGSMQQVQEGGGGWDSDPRFCFQPPPRLYDASLPLRKKHASPRHRHLMMSSAGAVRPRRT